VSSQVATPPAPPVPALATIADGTYAIRASTGHYLVAEGGGGGDANANREHVGQWERFTVVHVGDKIAFQTFDGHYLVAEGGGGADLNANRTEIGPWEQFAAEDLGNGEIALRTNNGHLVTAEGGGGGETNANRTEVGPWEHFRLEPLPDGPTLALGVAITLRSYNYPDRFIRHAGSLGQLSPIATALDLDDATFKVVPGLAGDYSISLESIDHPGFYLRHQDFAIKLHQDDGSALFRDDASFHVVPGRADDGAISLESVNYPGRFLRHRDFQLFLEPADSALASADATFVVAPQ
jgi:hypothetical protein